MIRKLLWLSVVLVLIFGGKKLVDSMSRSANERTATTRVEGFLKGETAGGDFQHAINMWLSGSEGEIGRMTQDQYNAAVQELNAWLARRGLSRIDTYEVASATMVQAPEGASAAIVDVSCTINGRPALIRAVQEQRLEWVD